MGLLYGGIAAAGYYYFGDGSQQVITANLKENSPFASQGSFWGIPGLTLDNAIGGFVLLNAFTTYPALIMIVQDMLWALFGPAVARRKRRRSEGGGGGGGGGGVGNGSNSDVTSPQQHRQQQPLPLQPLPRLFLRLVAAVLTAAVAVGAYSSVADCLALLGGMSSMSCSLLLPAACFLKLAGGGGGNSSSAANSPAGAPLLHGEEDEGGGGGLRRGRAKRPSEGKLTPAARGALVSMLVGGSLLTAAVVGQSLADLIHDADNDDGGSAGRNSLVAAVLALRGRRR